MAASATTITLANGTSVTIACQVCGNPATQGILLKLCQDCGTHRKSGRKHDLDDSENENEKEEFESAIPTGATSYQSAMPEDVEIKRLDRPNDNSGFDGQGTILARFCAQQNDQALVFSGVVEDTGLDVLKMLPSAVNFPLEYCRTMHEAGALISTWLTKSLQEIDVFFAKKGVFLGPNFVLFQIPVIACRLKQTVEYGIDGKRWRVDRILDERVRGYRMAAKQFELKCKELRQKIKSWNANNADCQVHFEAVSDPVAKIEAFSAQIVNAWRPTLEPKHVSMLFGGLSVSSTKTSNDKPNKATVARARQMQKSSVFAPATKKQENKAKGDNRDNDNNENKKSEKKPTAQQIFYASAEPKQVAYFSTLQADPSANRLSPKSFKVDYGANEYVARQRAKSATEKVCDIGADESEEPAPNDLYTLPALNQEQFEDMQEELDIDIVDGLQKANTHDALQIELYRRERQLEATPKIHVKKRNAISGMIEKLKQKMLLG